MKFGLLLVLSFVNAVSYAGDTINGWLYSSTTSILVDGNQVVGANGGYNQCSWDYQPGYPNYFDVNTYTSVNDFWMGNKYVLSAAASYGSWDNVDQFGDNLLLCRIFIFPGDSVNVKDVPGQLNRTFYRPDSVFEDEFYLYCPDAPEYDNYFTIVVQYLPDSLQHYYLTHFDTSYMDSLSRVDSIKKIDSLATIQNIEAGKQNIIYPNPTNGLLIFTNYYTSNGTAGVEIFDLNGREVMEQNFEVSPGLQTNPVDMGNLPNGVYLVQYTVNGDRRTEKVIKM